LAAVAESRPTIAHRQHVVSGAKPHRTGRPIYWPQDAIRRAATALRECRSNDTFTLARIALEAALRSESDLIDLLPSDAAAMSALTRRTVVVGGIGYVR
jgi:hypothetical protein